ESSKPFAPVYILQKVWSKGLDHWTTKALKDAFAKDLNLNILLDAEIALLRDTIREGLQDGHWDMKVGEKIYLKTDVGAIREALAVGGFPDISKVPHPKGHSPLQDFSKDWG
ncbi:MAG: hypothetical protein RLZZ499_685, partial [Cyanobacteriota bacterium]